jgi:hypothetical protein
MFEIGLQLIRKKKKEFSSKIKNMKKKNSQALTKAGLPLSPLYWTDRQWLPVS